MSSGPSPQDDLREDRLRDLVGEAWHDIEGYPVGPERNAYLGQLLHEAASIVAPPSGDQMAARLRRKLRKEKARHKRHNRHHRRRR